LLSRNCKIARSTKKRNIAMQANSQWLFSQSIQYPFICSPRLVVPSSRNFLWRKLAHATTLFEIIFASPAVRLYGMIHVGRETRAIKHWDKARDNISPFCAGLNVRGIQIYDSCRNRFYEFLRSTRSNPRIFQNYAAANRRPWKAAL